MTLQEYRVQEGARVDTQVVDYRDHDLIEQLIARGWTQYRRATMGRITAAGNRS